MQTHHLDDQGNQYHLSMMHSSMQGQLGPFEKQYPRLYPATGANLRDQSDDNHLDRQKTSLASSEKLDQQISKIMRENNGNIFEIHQEKNNPSGGQGQS